MAGSLIIAGRGLELFDLAYRKRIKQSVHEQPNPIPSCAPWALTPNQERLVSLDPQGTVTVWDTRSLNEVSVYSGRILPRNYVCSGPLPNQVVIGTYGQGSTVPDVCRQQLVLASRIDKLAGTTRRFAFSSDLSRAIMLFRYKNEDKISILHWPQANLEKTLSGYVLAEFSRDGSMLVTSDTSSLYFWQTGEWNEPLAVGRPIVTSSIQAIDLAPDKRTLWRSRRQMAR